MLKKSAFILGIVFGSQLIAPPRAHAIFGLATSNPVMAVIGGVVLAGAVAGLIPRAYGWNVLAKYAGVTIGVGIGLFLLPSADSAVQFLPLTPAKLSELGLRADDARLPAYRGDRAKLNRIAEVIQDRVAQLPQNASNEQVLQTSQAVWDDYRPTLRPQTWSLVVETVRKTVL